MTDPSNKDHVFAVMAARVGLDVAIANPGAFSFSSDAVDAHLQVVTRQRQRTCSLRDKRLPAKKLLLSEEQAITKYILELDEREFLPTHSTCQDMANKLLAEHQEFARQPAGQRS